MPSPEKERRSGRLGRVLAALRPSRAGPLPVQTGFPTSLADLFVKNHGRLKKQPSPSSSSSSNNSSKRRKGGVSSSASPSPSPPPSSSPPAPPPASLAAAAVSRVHRPRPDLSPALAVRRDESSGFGLGLGFLAVSGVVSLALLVIWSKKVVAAVTVASFSLFLLESLRCSSLRRRRWPAATERQLSLDGRGRVSPIREAETETEPALRPSCSDSDGGIEASVLVAEETSAVLVYEWSDSKGKTKGRSWKKLIAASAKRLHKGRKHRKEAEDCLGSFRSEGDRGDATTLIGDVKATDSSSRSPRRVMASETDVVADAVTADEPDSLGSRRLCSGEIHVISPTEVDAPADLTKEEEEEEDAEEKAAAAAAGEAGVRFPALVLVAVDLAGLVVGKLPAVAFTMLCAALFCSVRRFTPCRGEATGRGGKRLELPVVHVN